MRGGVGAYRSKLFFSTAQNPISLKRVADRLDLKKRSQQKLPKLLDNIDSPDYQGFKEAWDNLADIKLNEVEVFYTEALGEKGFNSDLAEFEKDGQVAYEFLFKMAKLVNELKSVGKIDDLSRESVIFLKIDLVLKYPTIEGAIYTIAKPLGVKVSNHQSNFWGSGEGLQLTAEKNKFILRGNIELCEKLLAGLERIYSLVKSDLFRSINFRPTELSLASDAQEEEGEPSESRSTELT